MIFYKLRKIEWFNCYLLQNIVLIAYFMSLSQFLIKYLDLIVFGVKLDAFTVFSLIFVYFVSFYMNNSKIGDIFGTFLQIPVFCLI